MTQSAGKRVRTCVSCGKQSDKVRLLRIVRTPDGRVSFDATGRCAGRGAYVCSVACLETAMKGNKLQRALRVPLAREDAERVAAELIAACAAQAS